MRNKPLILWGLLAAAVPAGAVPVTLEWDAVTLNEDATPISDLFGYWLYYSTQSFDRGGWITPAQARQPGSGVTRVSVAANQTTRTLDLAGDNTYYFRLTAYDTSSNESGFNLALPPSSADEEASAFLAGGPVIVSIGGTPPGLREAFVFPNPSAGQDPVIRALMGDVDDVEITIFDAAGRSVHADRVPPSGQVNGQTAFDYRWTGEKASGVYYAVIHGRKGSERVRARAAFAVIR